MPLQVDEGDDPLPPGVIEIPACHLCGLCFCICNEISRWWSGQSHPVIEIPSTWNWNLICHIWMLLKNRQNHFNGGKGKENGPALSLHSRLHILNVLVWTEIIKNFVSYQVGSVDCICIILSSMFVCLWTECETKLKDFNISIVVLHTILPNQQHTWIYKKRY